MATIRVFMSFDVDHDEDLHDRLLEHSQRRGSMFRICGRSMGGELTDRWVARSRTHISAADEVIFICAEHTRASEHMGAELRITQEQDKPYLLIWGRRESMCTKPDGARRNDDIYMWTREIVESQMLAAIRKREDDGVPESYKRST